MRDRTWRLEWNLPEWGYCLVLVTVGSLGITLLLLEAAYMTAREKRGEHFPYSKPRGKIGLCSTDRQKGKAAAPCNGKDSGANAKTTELGPATQPASFPPPSYE